MNLTSSLPFELINLLDHYSKLLSIPKSRIIEKALNDYFEKIKKAEYDYSFRKANGDAEIYSMAEDGLEDYLNILDKE